MLGAGDEHLLHTYLGTDENGYKIIPFTQCSMLKNSQGRLSKTCRTNRKPVRVMKTDERTLNHNAKTLLSPYTLGRSFQRSPLWQDFFLKVADFSD